MTCPRCRKESSRDLRFSFKHGKRRVYLNARICNVCNFIYAEDAELLKAARKHLYALAEEPIVDDGTKPTNKR